MALPLRETSAAGAHGTAPFSGLWCHAVAPFGRQWTAAGKALACMSGVLGQVGGSVGVLGLVARPPWD